MDGHDYVEWGGTVPPGTCVCVSGACAYLCVCAEGCRLRAPKGQAWLWILCEQVARDPGDFRGACGDRQGPCSLPLAQNTLALRTCRAAVGQGRAEVAGGA